MRSFRRPSTVLLAACGLILFCGCPKAPTREGGTAPVGEEGSEEHAGHDHAAGPHDGDVVELGDEDYHAEIVHDDETGDVAVYILDGELKNAVPIPMEELTLNLVVAEKPQSFKLTPAPLKGEPEGMSSRFQRGGDDELVEALHGGATGRVNVEIAGKTYRGAIGGHSHGHDHDHDHEGDEEHEGEEDAEGEHDHDHDEGEEDHDHDHDEGEEDHDHDHDDEDSHDDDAE